MNTSDSPIDNDLLIKQIVLSLIAIGVCGTLKAQLFNNGSFSLQECFGAISVISIPIYMEISKNESKLKKFLNPDSVMENDFKIILYGLFVFLSVYYGIPRAIEIVIVGFNVLPIGSIVVGIVYNFVAYIAISISFAMFAIVFLRFISRQGILG